MAYTSVKISANSSDYQSQMKAATTQMKLLSSEYSVAATQAKLFGKETDGLKAKAESLTQKIEVQKDIVKLNSEQQEKLTKKLSGQKTKQEELTDKIKDARKAYEESSEATGENTEETQNLKKKLVELEQEFRNSETAIEKTETALANQSAKVNQSKNKLMEMESELKKVNDELKNHKLDKFAEGCEKAGEKIEELGKKMSVISGGVAAVGTAVAKNALDTENDLMKLQGQLGLTTEETEQLKTVAQNIYKNGFGENLEDCSNAVAILMQNVTGTKDMSVEQQQAITKQMMTMQELFETENEELTRTLTTMLNNGIINDISEGMDILTVGFQNGANYSGELLDTMREYSPKFKELGLDAETAMAYLIQGANNGAFNLDKVGDAMKEFSIRAVDGSDSTVEGFKKIGLNADEMAKKFAAGGDTAAQAFQEALTALNNMDDPIEQNMAGVALFGTMWEDLGKDVILSLADVEGALENVEGATEKAGEQINNSFSTEAKVQFRELQDSLLPLGDELLRLAKDAMPTVKEVVEDVTQVLKNMDSETTQNVIKIGAVVAATGPAITVFGKMTTGMKGVVDGYKKARDFGSKATTAVKTFGTKTIETTKKVGTFVANLGKSAAGFVKTAAKATASTASMIAHKTASVASAAATKTMTVAQTALNTVMSMNPIALVVIALTALAAGFVVLYNKSEKFRNAVDKLWSTVKEGFGNIKETISETFDNAKEKIEETKEHFSEEITEIKTTVSNGWENMKSTVKTKMTEWKTNVSEKLNEIKTNFNTKVGEYKTTVSNGWTNMKTTISTKMQECKSSVNTKLTEMKANITTRTDEIKSDWSSKFTNIKDTTTNLMQTAKSNVSAKLTEIKQGFSTKLNEAKSTVTSIMENIRSAFSSKMESAKTAVSNAIEKIKGFFNFSWSLPHIKLPHFSISGSFSLNPPSTPHFSVEWYKTGGIMTNPTVFGINGNSLMVGGEAGTEAILPLSEFYTKLNNILDKKLEAVQRMQNVYVENHTYIDSDEVASRTVSKVDSELVSNQRKGR